MGLDAGNGQPAPPARRVRVGWCPSRYVPASACVISPPPHGEGASGTPWAILSGEFQELGTTGNVRSAAATAGWYWSRLELPTPPLTNPGEGADRPSARNSPRRTPQVARSAVAPSCSRTTFCETWQSRNRMSLWSEKARTLTHLVSGRLLKIPTDRVSKTYERGVLWCRYAELRDVQGNSRNSRELAESLLKYCWERGFLWCRYAELRDVQGNSRNSRELAESLLKYCWNFTDVSRAPPCRMFSQRLATPLTRRAFCGCTNAHFDAFPTSRPSNEV
jgi:hypothetical protein